MDHLITDLASQQFLFLVSAGVELRPWLLDSVGNDRILITKFLKGGVIDDLNHEERLREHGDGNNHSDPHTTPLLINEANIHGPKQIQAGIGHLQQGVNQKLEAEVLPVIKHHHVLKLGGGGPDGDHRTRNCVDCVAPK